jgi:hypothetical protein
MFWDSVTSLPSFERVGKIQWLLVFSYDY